MTRLVFLIRLRNGLLVPEKIRDGLESRRLDIKIRGGTTVVSNVKV